MNYIQRCHYNNMPIQQNQTKIITYSHASQPALRSYLIAAHRLYSLVYLFLPLLLAYVQCTLIIDSYIISSLTNYSIQLTQFATTAPAGSLVQLQLPAEYSADDLNSNKPYIGDVFADGNCPSTCAGVAISYSGLIFNITGLFPTDEIILFKYYITNVPNPRVARTVGSYAIRVIDPSNNVIYNQAINGRTFLPKSMACTATAIEETQINFEATAYFQINPVTNPRDSPMTLVQLQFPSKWSLEPIVASTLPTEVYCLSSLQPQLQCSRSSQIITLTSVAFASSLSFEVHSIQNPSSAMNAGTVVISTMTSNRYKLDTCSISISGFEKNYLRLPSISISYTSSTAMDIQVSATFPARVAAGTLIMFTFPSSLPLAGATFSMYLAGNLMPSVVPIHYSSNNTVVINPFTALIFRPSIQISCTGVTRPRSAFVMSNIVINSYYNGNMVSTMTCCSTALDSRTSLTVVSIVTDKPYLQTPNSQYTITITTSIIMTSTDTIYIYYPKQYSLGTGTKPCTVTSATAPTTGSPICTLASGNLIKVSSFLSANASSSTFTIVISNIQNPARNPSWTPFQIYTLDSAQQIIQHNTASYVTISAAQITTMTVNSPNKLVLNSPSQYVLQFVTNGLVLTNYHIVAHLPTEVGIKQSSLGCTVGGKAFPCWYTSASHQVSIRITSDLVSTTVNVVLNGGINPQSLQPSGNYGISILDGDSNVIEVSSSALTPTITMTSTQSFKYAWAKFNTDTNIHRAGTLFIVVQSLYPIRPTHKLIITYTNTQMLFNGSSSASQCTSTTLAGLLCANDTTAHTITLTNIAYTPNSDTLYFNISNVIALVRYPSLTLTLVNSANYKCLESSVAVSSALPDLITYTLTQTSYVLQASADITINYAITYLASSSPSLSTLTALSYMLVQVPAQYTTSAANNIFNTSSLTGSITITGVTNPNYTQYVSSYFYLIGYNTNNQVTAVSINNLVFAPVCNMPCRTCVSASAMSNCLTCYSWHTLYMLYTNASTSTSTCVSQCPRYYFYNTTSLTCEQCNSNCLECDQSVSTKCLSCPSSPVQYYLHEVDYRCYSDCPGGYYESNNSHYCRACTPNCLTCLNQSYCSTCANTYYYYNNQCLSACPPTTYILSASSLSCVNCPTTNCLHCSSAQCLACTPPYYLYNKLCYLSCPSPLLPTLSRTCRACECRTCATYASVCTSCTPTSAKPYLYNSYCYASCPMGTYIGNANTCTSCPFNCITCTNYLVCLKCKQNYALYTTNATYIQCISTSACPSSTILTLSSTDIPVCQPCTSPCASCNISVTFCLTCITNYNLHNHTCVSTCPSPLHPINGKCQKCIPQCLTCMASDEYNCTQCQPGYFLNNYTCYSSCPSSTYMDVSGKQCISCNPLCQACANSTNCTACVTGYFLFNWFCYSGCPTTPVMYYQYNGTCTPCQPQCVSCINSPIACTSCSHPDYIYISITHECVFQCVSPYFRNGSTCILCQSPCRTCDTTFDSCLTCNTAYYLYNGTCVSNCPIGYFANSTSQHCQKCVYPCKICIQTQCLLCQSFAYMYQQMCVLQCPTDMPYEQPGYCSQCIGIGFCARCGSSSTTGSQICSECVYPYVLFQGACLNSCPTNYTVAMVDGVRGCEYTQQYMQYLSVMQQFNKPLLPPFFFLGLYIIAIVILVPVSHKLYRFTYHVGYMIGILSLIDALFLFYSLYYVDTRYEGQFMPIAPKVPFTLLIITLCINFIALTIIFWLWVQRTVYLTDIRYIQWKQRHKKYWWATTALMPVLGGPRFHKLNYSKLFGSDSFAFRIVSVQKFYQEDILTYLSAIGDVLEIAAFAICIFNISIGYKGLMFIGYECLGIKLIYWLLLLYDLKKPDRGFFIGDQEQAEIQMHKELEQEAKKLNRMDTQNLVKLVRTKSAQVIRNQKYFGDLDIPDFISVYDPDDYEPVIKVPNKKIEKNIYKGKFRKGRKITIQQKLNKFADSVKPKPVINKKKVDSYLNNLIYWRPPQRKKIIQKKILPPSEQSMLQLLEQKQLQYKEDLDNIQLIQQQKQGKLGKQRKYYARPRYDQRTFLDDIDETIPNETVQFFYPSHSIETEQKKNSIDFDDLLNLNYARKRHLNKQQNLEERRYQSKRKLHHQPQKKRNNLTGFGQMILKKS